MATSLLPDCGLSTEKFTHWLLVMCGQEKMILKYTWGKWEEGSGKTEKDPRGKHCCYLSDGYLYICLHKLSRELQRTTITTCFFLSSHMYSGNIIFCNINSTIFHTVQVCFSAFCGCKKQYDQKWLGDQRVHLVYACRWQSITEGNHGRNSCSVPGRNHGGRMLSSLLFPVHAQLVFLCSPDPPA